MTASGLGRDGNGEARDSVAATRQSTPVTVVLVALILTGAASMLAGGDIHGGVSAPDTRGGVVQAWWPFTLVVGKSAS